ncbi:MAG: DUF5667 domain-containing protein [Candidatus Paceibacterota bacterium]
MKKITLKELRNEAQTFSMTENEKKTTWNGVLYRVNELQKNNVCTTPEASFVRNMIPSRLYYRGLLPALDLRTMAHIGRTYVLGLVIGSLVLSGGVSVFADDILPGDILYPIKVNVVEGAHLAISFTTPTKAATEATLATRRLEEAEKLAAEGRLDLETEEQANIAFDAHIRKFNEHIETLQAEGNPKEVVEVGTFLQTRLAVHDAILKNLVINDENFSFLEEWAASTTDAHHKVYTATRLEKKLSQAVIPVVVATKKAIEDSVDTSLHTPIVTTKHTFTHGIPLDINSKEADEYLATLRRKLKLNPSLKIVIPISPVIDPITTRSKKD